MAKRFVLAALLLAASLHARADAALETRVNDLASQLRCVVCQNQTLADSQVQLAVDLKNQIRQQFLAGRSEAQVTDFMTARYGDFINYRPPLRVSTWLLWYGPLLLLAAGLALLARSLREQKRAPPDSADDVLPEEAP